MPEDEAERFEEEYFVDDERFAELLDVEDELIDEFLHRRLSSADRRLFESRFLNTDSGRAKVAMAAVLEKTKTPASRSPGFRELAIAAAVLMVVVGGALIRELVVMRGEIDSLQREQMTLRSTIAARTDEIRRIQSGDKREEMFSTVVMPVERGSAAAPTLTLPGDAGAAELWLLLPQDDHPAYSVTLQSVDGQTVWRESGLKSRTVDSRKAIVIRVPMRSLPPGTFIAGIMGEKPDGSTETIEDLSFNVRRP